MCCDRPLLCVCGGCLYLSMWLCDWVVCVYQWVFVSLPVCLSLSLNFLLPHWPTCSFPSSSDWGSWQRCRSWAGRPEAKKNITSIGTIMKTSQWTAKDRIYMHFLSQDIPPTGFGSCCRPFRTLRISCERWWKISQNRLTNQSRWVGCLWFSKFHENWYSPHFGTLNTMEASIFAKNDFWSYYIGLTVHILSLWGQNGIKMEPPSWAYQSKIWWLCDGCFICKIETLFILSNLSLSSLSPLSVIFIITITTICHYYHHNQHYLSLLSSQSPPSVTIIIKTTTICHYYHHKTTTICRYYHHNHHNLSLVS